MTGLNERTLQGKLEGSSICSETRGEEMLALQRSENHREKKSVYCTGICCSHKTVTVWGHLLGRQAMLESLHQRKVSKCPPRAI